MFFFYVIFYLICQWTILQKDIINGTVSSDFLPLLFLQRKPPGPLSKDYKIFCFFIAFTWILDNLTPRSFKKKYGEKVLWDTTTFQLMPCTYITLNFNVWLPGVLEWRETDSPQRGELNITLHCPFKDVHASRRETYQDTVYPWYCPYDCHGTHGTQIPVWSLSGIEFYRGLFL